MTGTSQTVPRKVRQSEQWMHELEGKSIPGESSILAIYLKSGSVIRLPVDDWSFRKRTSGEFTALYWKCSSGPGDPELVGIRLGEIIALVEEPITEPAR